MPPPKRPARSARNELYPGISIALLEIDFLSQDSEMAMTWTLESVKIWRISDIFGKILATLRWQILRPLVERGNATSSARPMLQVCRRGAAGQSLPRAMENRRRGTRIQCKEYFNHTHTHTNIPGIIHIETKKIIQIGDRILTRQPLIAIVKNNMYIIVVIQDIIFKNQTKIKNKKIHTNIANIKNEKNFMYVTHM